MVKKEEKWRKMKKIVKIYSIILIILILLCTISTTFVYAQNALPNANEYEPGNESVPNNVTDMVGTIATIIQVIGVALSVIVLVMLGIKYMIGSVEEKAMIPFLIGTVLITATSTIVRIIADLTSQAIEG